MIATRAREPAWPRRASSGARRHAPGARRQRHGRGERSGEGVCARSRARCAQHGAPVRAARGAHLRRRDHRHACAARARRALQRVPAVARDRAGRAGRRVGARLRHRRHRRQRGQRRRAARARFAAARARAKGSIREALLADNDGYGFFAALGDLVVTGPTRTNVNDYRVHSRPMSRHDGALAALALGRRRGHRTSRGNPASPRSTTTASSICMMAQAISPFGQASPAVLAAMRLRHLPTDAPGAARDVRGRF